MNADMSIVDESGRVQLPQHLRDTLGIKTGESVTVEIVGQELRIRSVLSGVREAQRRFREVVPEGRSLSDDLIADRRAEAARE